MSLDNSWQHHEHCSTIPVASWHNHWVILLLCSVRSCYALYVSLRPRYNQYASAATELFRHSQPGRFCHASAMLMASWPTSGLIRMLSWSWCYSFVKHNLFLSNVIEKIYSHVIEEFHSHVIEDEELSSILKSLISWSKCPNCSCLSSDNHWRTQNFFAFRLRLAWTSSSNISLWFIMVS